MALLMLFSLAIAPSEVVAATKKRSTTRKSSTARRRPVRKPAATPAKPKPPPPPSAEQIAQEAVRNKAYSVSAQAYKLYDEGVNARLSGQLDLAKSKLKDSSAKLQEIISYQKSGYGSTLQSHVEFELGRVYDAAADAKSAREAYIRCVRIRPSHMEAHVRLVDVLAREGQMELALSAARACLKDNPRDPRASLLLSLLLYRQGEQADARVAKESYMRFLSPGSQLLPPEAVGRLSRDTAATVDSAPSAQSENSENESETFDDSSEDPDPGAASN